MLTAAKMANLTIRFLLELGLLVAVATTTWQTVGHPIARFVAVVTLPAAVAVGPAAVAVGWAVFVHGSHMPGWASVTAQVVALLIAVAALVRIATPGIAAAAACVAVVNALLPAVWDQ